MNGHDEDFERVAAFNREENANRERVHEILEAEGQGRFDGSKTGYSPSVNPDQDYRTKRPRKARRDQGVPDLDVDELAFPSSKRREDRKNLPSFMDYYSVRKERIDRLRAELVIENRYVIKEKEEIQVLKSIAQKRAEMARFAEEARERAEAAQANVGR
jgi:hypothetical protein